MIAVVKYNAGNTHSVVNALSRIGYECTVTDDERTIRSADHVIFPGVGEASSAMSYLRSSGLDKTLSSLEQPFLGICLGMQLMTRHSEEGDVDLLSIYPEESVLRFPSDRGYKIPHVGWNDIKVIDDRLFYSIPSDSYFYFVHSYYVDRSSHSAALCTYDDITFSAALSKDNYFGIQFHPEKSGKLGERVLRNFLEVIK